MNQGVTFYNVFGEELFLSLVQREQLKDILQAKQTPTKTGPKDIWHTQTTLQSI
jgi:hypothetical protein